MPTRTRRTTKYDAASGKKDMGNPPPPATDEAGGRRSRLRPGARSPRISAVLLAAGSSTRFGDTKQLALIDADATMIERAVETLKRSRVEKVVVVLGSRSKEIRERLRGVAEGVLFVENPEFRSGLSSSLKAGLRATSQESDAVVVALADQPLVTSRLVDAVISRYLDTRCAVVTASSGDVISPPALFDRSVFGELMALQGDVGARQVILDHAPFERVEVDRDELIDVDTKTDMEKARKRLAPLRGTPGTNRRRVRAGGGSGRARPSSG
jgi:molybdenum cofactor cytidylyltransferase